MLCPIKMSVLKLKVQGMPGNVTFWHRNLWFTQQRYMCHPNSKRFLLMAKRTPGKQVSIKVLMKFKVKFNSSLNINMRIIRQDMLILQDIMLIPDKGIRWDLIMLAIWTPYQTLLKPVCDTKIFSGLIWKWRCYNKSFFQNSSAD